LFIVKEGEKKVVKMRAGANGSEADREGANYERAKNGVGVNVEGVNGEGVNCDETNIV
jgi:hypothetical protein